MLAKKNRHDSAPVRLVPPVNKKSRPALLVSAILILGSCLAGVWWWTWYDQSVPTVVATANISQGETITRSDLAVIETSGDFGRITTLDQVVGRLAAGPIGVGEPLTTTDMADTISVAPGNTVLGVLLKPGDYPTPKVSIGSRVDVFTAATASSEAKLVAENVEVFDITVSETGVGNEILYALVLTRSEAVEVTNASTQQGGVKIALRGSQ